MKSLKSILEQGILVEPNIQEKEMFNFQEKTFLIGIIAGTFLGNILFKAFVWLLS